VAVSCAKQVKEESRDKSEPESSVTAEPEPSGPITQVIVEEAPEAPKADEQTPAVPESGPEELPAAPPAPPEEEPAVASPGETAPAPKERVLSEFARTYPDFANGILAEASLAELGEAELLRSGDMVITREMFDKTINEIPEEERKKVAPFTFFFLNG